MKLQPIIALYGETHVPYARALLASLRGGSRPILVWDQLDADAQVAFARDADLVHTALPTTPDRLRRVAGKLYAWRAGFRACGDTASNNGGGDGDCALFLDADTLVLGRLDSVFDDAEGEFDVAATKRSDRRWPVNSGVVLARFDPRVARWLDDWCDMTFWVLGDEQRLQRAIDGWGGADQAALVASLALHGGHEGLRVAWLDAARWNEDWVPADPARVVIAHLKGALPQLLDPSGDAAVDLARRVIFDRWRAFHAESGTPSTRRSD